MSGDNGKESRRFVAAAEEMTDGYSIRNYRAGRDSSHAIIPRNTFDRGYEVRDPAGGLVGRTAYRDEALQMVENDRARARDIAPS